MAAPAADTYREPRAHDLRARYHAYFEAAELPVPVDAIAEDLLGLHVEEADLGPISGLLYPGQREIVLNRQDTPARRRFTLAHELGHWVCQCAEGRGAPVMCRTEEVGLDPSVKALEREANIFAAELLMPEPAVRGAWTGSIAEAAGRFGVSEEAMHWRLYSFGLASQRPGGEPTS